MSTEPLTGTIVHMPALGESIDEGTVTRWLKQPGNPVTAEEPLLEVATDKVDTEIPSPVTGILHRILTEENDVVAVGAELAVITEADTGAGSVNAAPVPVPVSTWISQRPRSDGVPFAATAGAAQHCLPVEVGRM